ncbi:MAG: hypothetical protein JKY53_03070, partial [Flavobacteriales bacterium]|nr:hypothetical protein [Flavobacteriales bacterium]
MKNTILVSAIAASLVGVGCLTMNSNTDVSASYEKRTQLTFNEKAQSWKHAQEFQKMFRADVNTGEIDIRDVLKGREQAEFLRGQRAGVGLEWKERGPDNVGGRTRAILVDKLDTTGNTVYAGSVAGGLFKSINGAATWEPIDDHSDSPAISCIDQGMGGTIYVGTGCSFENFDGSGSSGMIGKGLYKSTDGETFTILTSTLPAANATGDGWAHINGIAVDPTNDNRVFAATKGGLMLTEDGGTTWDVAAFNTAGFTVASGNDVRIADDGTVLYAAGGKVMHSPDGDIGSFIYVTGTGTPTGSRTIVKFAPSNNDTVWALSASGGELGGFYLSTDRGETWSYDQGENSGVGFGSCCGLFNGQANYDLALGVNPKDASTVYIGGVQLWRYDGSLTRIAGEFGGGEFNVHSDKHDVYFDPHNPNKMFVASDGGIHVSYNQGQTYFSASKGYNTFSCYGIALDKDGTMMGGAQDNGTWSVDNSVAGGIFTGLEGTNVGGGDGYDCDYSQITNISFSTIYSQAFSRGIDGASMGSMCTSGSPGPICDQGSFYTVGRLWENENDPTSQTTIVFTNTNAPQAI